MIFVYVFKNYIEGLPFVNEPGFISAVAKVVENNKIDFFYPAHDSVVVKASEHNQEIGCYVVGSGVETCRICRSKKLTYEHLKNIVSTPIVYDNVEQCGNFPVFVKPEKSQGSIGAKLIKSKQELCFYLSQNPELIILEYLPGPEYTIDCFTDRHGKLLFAGARKRVRTKSGISVSTYPVNNERLQSMAKQINKAIKFRGPWFFQAKERDNCEPVLLEAAPRIAGSSGLNRNLGINLPLLGILDAMDKEVNVLANNFKIAMDRALCNRFKTNLQYTQAYVDFDNCLINDCHVNTDIIKLIYQCINRDIKVHLFAKDSQKVKDALTKLRLNVFDDIIYLKQNQSRPDLIKNRPAVFISGSFTERSEVYHKLNIPVFSPDAVECLISSTSV